MQPETQKRTRSEQARINGAKSRGPKTPQGAGRSKTASITYGLYTQNPSLRSTVDDKAFESLRQQYQSVWSPANKYIADKVDDLVAIRWELNRLREVRRQYMARLFNDVQAIHSEAAAETSVVTETEIQANSQEGPLDRFDLRIRRCHLEISRAERDILRVDRYFSTNGPSQISLKTNEVEPEPNPIVWAEDTFDMALDPHQADVLTTQAPLTVLNAARYSGKTTALALRALFESLQDPKKHIACLSPNGALLNKVKELAAIGGYQLTNIAANQTKETKLILVDDAADIKNVPAFTPGAQIILAGTPRGAAGYFYDQWQNPDAVKIKAPAADCDTIPDDIAEQAKKLSKLAYKQEFECEFLATPQPRCSLLPFTQ
jgi:hypothetical protein